MNLEDICANKELINKDFITYHLIDGLKEEYGVLKCSQCNGYNIKCLGYVKK